MKGDERRTREMGVRVVLYSDRHPDTDPAHGVLVGKLKGVVEQMEQEEALQRSALMDRHTSSLDKRRLRREMLAGPVAHVVGVADLARKDEPSLATQVQYRPSGNTFGGHLAAARGLLAEAETHQELLAKYGLSADVLEVYREVLSQSEAAVRLGDEGRAAHKGATPHLKDLAREVRQIVRTWMAETGSASRTTRSCWASGSAPARSSGSPDRCRDGAGDVAGRRADAGVGVGAVAGQCAGWDAGSGRRREARSVRPGWVNRQRWRRRGWWKED